MSFALKGMEVLQRRQKKNKRCYDLEDYDDYIWDIIIEKSGCRPMWITNRSEPLCKTRKSYEDIMAMHADMFDGKNNKKYQQPCRSIEKAKLEYVEYDASDQLGVHSEDKDEGLLTLDFDMVTSKFKEIKQVRKYNYQSLIGNAGGYVGILLGYALWNIPTIAVDAWKYLKNIFSQQRGLLP